MNLLCQMSASPQPNSLAIFKLCHQDHQPRSASVHRRLAGTGKDWVISSQPALRGTSEVKSPLVPARWETALVRHPDAKLVDYILAGIRQGFQIGCNPDQPLCSAARNTNAVSNCQPPACDRVLAAQAAGRLPNLTSQGSTASYRTCNIRQARV